MNNYDKIVAATIYSYFSNLGIYDILEQNNAYLAGGAVRSFYDNTKINDFDLYLPSLGAARQVCEHLRCKKFKRIAYTSNAETFKIDNQTIQIVFRSFVTRHDNGDDIDLFPDFDFTVCKGAYSFKSRKMIIGYKTRRDIRLKSLKIVNNIILPIDTLNRVMKYILYGYTITKSEFDILTDLIKYDLYKHKLKKFTYYDNDKELLQVQNKYFNQYNDLVNYALKIDLIRPQGKQDLDDTFNKIYKIFEELMLEQIGARYVYSV